MESSDFLKRLRRSGAAFAILLLLLFAAPSAQAQCPMCKAAVESEHGQAPNETAKGLNTGIMMLFVLPYATITLIVVSVVVSRRRHNRAHAGNLS